MGQTVYLGGGNDSPEWIALWEADAASEISMNNWDAIRIGAATSHYNRSFTVMSAFLNSFISSSFDQYFFTGFRKQPLIIL